MKTGPKPQDQKPEIDNENTNELLDGILTFINKHPLMIFGSAVGFFVVGVPGIVLGGIGGHILNHHYDTLWDKITNFFGFGQDNEKDKEDNQKDNPKNNKKDLKRDNKKAANDKTDSLKSSPNIAEAEDYENSKELIAEINASTQPIADARAENEEDENENENDNHEVKDHAEHTATQRAEEERQALAAQAAQASQAESKQEKEKEINEEEIQEEVQEEVREKEKETVEKVAVEEPNEAEEPQEALRSQLLAPNPKTFSPSKDKERVSKQAAAPANDTNNDASNNDNHTQKNRGCFGFFKHFWKRG